MFTPEREGRSLMRAFRSLALGLASAAIWPLYLILLAYTARVAPWPRSLGVLVSAGFPDWPSPSLSTTC